MKKEYSLWDRSGTNGARTSALPVAHGWFHPALKTRSKKRRVYRESRKEGGNRNILYIIDYYFESQQPGGSAMPQRLAGETMMKMKVVMLMAIK